MTDDLEFTKSVSEKIEGLYYFNKKKYEAYLRQKQNNKGWFVSKFSVKKIQNIKETKNFSKTCRN